MKQEDIKKLEETIEQLRVQLAGCGVAALGYCKGENDCKKGDYGYSASLQDVKDLWDKYRKLDLVPELVVALELILPLAKGYVAHNEVGSNRKYLNIAEQVLSKYREVK